MMTVMTMNSSVVSERVSGDESRGPMDEIRMLKMRGLVKRSIFASDASGEKIFKAKKQSIYNADSALCIATDELTLKGNVRDFIVDCNKVDKVDGNKVDKVDCNKVDKVDGNKVDKVDGNKVDKVDGNMEDGNMEDGDEEYGNKEYGNKEYGNKEDGNKEDVNKEDVNKKDEDEEYGNKEYGNKENMEYLRGPPLSAPCVVTSGYMSVEVAASFISSELKDPPAPFCESDGEENRDVLIKELTYTQEKVGSVASLPSEGGSKNEEDSSIEVSAPGKSSNPELELDKSGPAFSDHEDGDREIAPIQGAEYNLPGVENSTTLEITPAIDDVVPIIGEINNMDSGASVDENNSILDDASIATTAEYKERVEVPVRESRPSAPISIELMPTTPALNLGIEELNFKEEDKADVRLHSPLLPSTITKPTNKYESLLHRNTVMDSSSLKNLPPTTSLIPLPQKPPTPAMVVASEANCTTKKKRKEGKRDIKIAREFRKYVANIKYKFKGRKEAKGATPGRSLSDAHNY